MGDPTKASSFVCAGDEDHDDNQPPAPKYLNDGDNCWRHSPSAEPPFDRIMLNGIKPPFMQAQMCKICGARRPRCAFFAMTWSN
jgi:hypothetical protein